MPPEGPDGSRKHAMILRLLLRLFYFLFLIFIFRAVFRHFMGPSSSKPSRPPAPAAPPRTVSGQMEKDPVCGMYIDKQTALSWEKKGRTFYFCSDECRRKFQSQS